MKKSGSLFLFPQPHAGLQQQFLFSTSHPVQHHPQLKGKKENKLPPVSSHPTSSPAPRAGAAGHVCAGTLGLLAGRPEHQAAITRGGAGFLSSLIPS